MRCTCVCIHLFMNTQDGDTALSLAARRGRVESVQSLLKRGAVIDEKDKVRYL